MSRRRESSTSFSLKRVLLGRPLATEEEHAQRLPKKLALPVFASDAISSNAYATEEILLVLVTVGTIGLSYLLPVTIAVVVLLVVVALSYRQTVHAYPSGGGSYVVGSENLGLLPGLIAAAALLVDYVMTVAVSVAAGVAALTSAFPPLLDYRVIIAVAFVALMVLANLRGLRESGVLFSIPTYAFIGLCGAMIVAGIVRWATSNLHPVPAVEQHDVTHVLTVFLLLRAFAGGCAAMTGTEAISNGVPAFKPPESRNAGITLGIMAAVLATFFLGISFLSHALDIVPGGGQTVLSQVGRAVYGGMTPLYYALQIATMAILFVAAQTSFAGFPRLASILAGDGFLPRQLMNRGDRLAFSNGIIGLAILSIALLIVFRAETHALIPLYAVGVFTSFTISQSGMVRHWFRSKEPGWHGRALMNGFGAVMTAIVAVVVVSVKFLEGAYLVVIAIPVIITIFYAIHRHYGRVAKVLEPQTGDELKRLGEIANTAPRTTVVLFVSQVNEMTARSLFFAKALSPDEVHAVTIKGDDKRLEQLEDSWAEMRVDVPLKVVESPYRELVRPAVQYIRSLDPSPTHMVTVVIPEFVVEHWYEQFLHNQNALRLKAALLLVPWVVVVSVPFHIGVSEQGLILEEGLGDGGDVV